MGEIVLDGRRMLDKEILYLYLRQELPLPGLGGDNLDALHDHLSAIRGPLLLKLCYAEAMELRLGDYARRFQRMLLDSAAQNPGLQVEIRRQG